jgi:hypothetical protein
MAALAEKLGACLAHGDRVAGAQQLAGHPPGAGSRAGAAGAA